MTTLPQKDLTTFFLSAGFSGYLPKMPGTYGSIVGLILAFFIMYEGGFTEQPWLNSIILVALAMVFYYISIPLINKYERETNNYDASWIVIDEVVGVFLALSWYPIWYSWWLPIIGLAIFRYFDIAKPFPVSWANEKRGGKYVLIDDIIAGVITVLVMVSLVFFLRFVEILSSFT